MTPARLDPEVVMVRLERIAADAPPADYRSSFTDLADHGILDRDLAERLAAWAGLRNVLVQLYIDIDVTTVARAHPHGRRRPTSPPTATSSPRGSAGGNHQRAPREGATRSSGSEPRSSTPVDGSPPCRGVSTSSP